MLVSLFGYCRLTGSFFGFVIVCLSLYDSAVKLLAELSVYAILFSESCFRSQSCGIRTLVMLPRMLDAVLLYFTLCAKW